DEAPAELDLGREAAGQRIPRRRSGRDGWHTARPCGRRPVLRPDVVGEEVRRGALAAPRRRRSERASILSPDARSGAPGILAKQRPASRRKCADLGPGLRYDRKLWIVEHLTPPAYPLA